MNVDPTRQDTEGAGRRVLIGCIAMTVLTIIVILVVLRLILVEFSFAP